MRFWVLEWAMSSLTEITNAFCCKIAKLILQYIECTHTHTTERSSVMLLVLQDLDIYAKQMQKLPCATWVWFCGTWVWLCETSVALLDLCLTSSTLDDHGGCMRPNIHQHSILRRVFFINLISRIKRQIKLIELRNVRSKTCKQLWTYPGWYTINTYLLGWMRYKWKMQ